MGEVLKEDDEKVVNFAYYVELVPRTKLLKCHWKKTRGYGNRGTKAMFADLIMIF